MKQLSYLIAWDKAILFMLEYDRIKMPYTVYIDRHGRCLIIAHVELFYNNIKKDN